MTKEEFLKDVQNWNNHLYLLWPALEATQGLVVEYGIGDGSTPYLNQYCRDADRMLISYENNDNWFHKWKHVAREKHIIYPIKDWSKIDLSPSVILLDHAPGDRRKEDILKYENAAQIIVIHDTEPAADHGYQMRQHFGRFKYHIDYKSAGAWASAVSNTIDVTKFEI